MGNKDIRDMFRKCETGKELEQYLKEDKKSAAIQELKIAVTEKSIVPWVTRSELLQNQLRFMNKKVLASQLVCFLLMLLLYMPMRQMLRGNVLFAMGAIAAALFSAFEAFAFSYEEACGIGEVAGACYFNNRQICLLQMILYTSVNMIILAVMTLLIWGNGERELYEIGIYVLVPFLVMGCMQFAVLLLGAGRRGNTVLMASAVFMILLFAVLPSIPEVYERGAVGIWLIVLAAGAGLYIVEIVLLLRRVEKGEVLCMN